MDIKYNKYEDTPEGNKPLHNQYTNLQLDIRGLVKYNNYEKLSAVRPEAESPYSRYGSKEIDERSADVDDANVYSEIGQPNVAFEGDIRTDNVADTGKGHRTTAKKRIGIVIAIVVLVVIGIAIGVSLVTVRKGKHDKTSVSQAEQNVVVKTSKFPHLTKAAVVVGIVVAIVVVGSVLGVVLSRNNEDNRDERPDESSLEQTDTTSSVTPSGTSTATSDVSSQTTDASSTKTNTLSTVVPGNTTGTGSEGDVWSEWGGWTSCSATCNNGIHTRYRQCNADKSTYCVGEYVQTEICIEATCPVYGKWTTWGSWSNCDATCGSGVQSRSRACTKTESSNLDCVGENTHSRACAEWDCPDCSKVCSAGILNNDCDRCVCNGNTISGRILAETTGNPISNAAIYAASSPTNHLATSNSTGYFSIGDTCTNTELLIIREGFVDTKTVPTSNNLEIKMVRIVMPYLTETPQSKNRLVGENVTFCCQTEANPAVDYIEWFKDTVLLDQMQYENGTELMLTYLTTASSGLYQCRVNSKAGAVMSPAATLTVKSNNDDFCSDALREKTITLPYDCPQDETNTTVYEVGECVSKKCISADLAKTGTCREEISSCCVTGDIRLETVQCSGYTLQVIVVTSCTCGTCSSGSTTISGTAIGYEDQSPLQFGEVWANNVFESYTSFNGDFSFTASNTVSKVTLTLKDTYYKKFLQTTKVVDISDEINANIYVEVLMFEAVEPIEIDSTVENTLVAGTSIDGSDTPIIEISVPADSFYYSNGKKYTGTVQASLTFLDPTNASILENIPGEFKFIDEEGEEGNLASLGVFNLYFEDSSGNPLVLDEIIDFYAPSVDSEETLDQNIMLWRMNSGTGVWEIINAGTGVRRRRRAVTSRWIGEIDWSTVDREQWYNYDMVYDLTDNPCYFKIRLFLDKTLREPVLNLERELYVQYHILKQNMVRTIEDYLDNVDNKCLTGICENDNAYMSMFYYGYQGYEKLYASEAQVVKAGHYYNVTDEETVLKIQMTASNDGPFYTDESICRASGPNDNHLIYHFGKKDESYIVYETYPDPAPGDINDAMYLSKRTWYPKREEGFRVCFIKVRLVFEQNVYLSSGQFIKLRATSIGGTNADIKDFIFGIHESNVEDETDITFCIEYKCSGQIDPNFFTSEIDYTKVVLQLIYPTSEIESEIIDEADFVSNDGSGRNEIQNGTITQTFTVYPPLSYLPELGIYSATSEDSDQANSIALLECRSGEPHNLDDDNPEIGLAVTFRVREFCNYWWCN